MEIDPEEFEEIRKESDTLGGMLLELTGDIPGLGQEIVFDRFTFKIEAVDKRRIKRIKVTIKQNQTEIDEN
jgi:CBS domain containing-hemolysin-like protein